MWGGDLEGGGGIDDMGDDITINRGDRGREFILHTQTQGAHIFAAYDNTQIRVDYLDSNNNVTATQTFTRNRDGFVDLPAQRYARITSNLPILVQTIGGNGLNDWGNSLSPPYNENDDCPDRP